MSNNVQRRKLEQRSLRKALALLLCFISEVVKRADGAKQVIASPSKSI